MSLRPRKRLVLAFIFGALALGGVMVYSFGGRNVFTRHELFLLYFDNSVNGLVPGSLVKFKGVPIGKVDSFQLRFRASPADHRVPVLIKINADVLQRQLGVLEDLSDPAVLANEIHRGLRGELDRESFVTGGTFVSLSFYPQAAAPKTESSAGGYDVIPTVPSAWVDSIDKTARVIAWLPTFDFRTEIGRVGDYLDTLNTDVSAIPFAEYHQEIVNSLQPLAGFDYHAWQRTMNDMMAHFDTDQQAIAAANNQYSSASQNFTNMNTAARQNLAQVDADLAHFRAQLAPATSWLQQTTDTMKGFSSDLGNLTTKLNNFQKQPDIVPKVSQ